MREISAECSAKQVGEVANKQKKRSWRVLVAVLLLLPPVMGVALWLASANPFYLIVGAKIRKIPARMADIPGDVQPTFTEAASVPIPDHEIVIGVLAFGKAKAYYRRSFSGPGTHIVHDRFGEVQVTVTHCNRTRCTRVFTAGNDQDLSILHCGGWLEEQELALLIGGRRFPQSSLDIPFADLPYVVTTWGKWRTKHPQSVVYLGGPEVTESLKRAKKPI